MIMGISGMPVWELNVIGFTLDEIRVKIEKQLEYLEANIFVM
jgi:hypothetical protein